MCTTDVLLILSDICKQLNHIHLACYTPCWSGLKKNFTAAKHPFNLITQFRCLWHGKITSKWCCVQSERDEQQWNISKLKISACFRKHFRNKFSEIYFFVISHLFPTFWGHLEPLGQFKVIFGNIDVLHYFSSFFDLRKFEK